MSQPSPTVQLHSPISHHVTCQSDSLKNMSVGFGVLGETALRLACPLRLLPSLVTTSLIKGLSSVALFLQRFYFCSPELPIHFPLCLWLYDTVLSSGGTCPSLAASSSFCHRHASTGLRLVFSSWPRSLANRGADAVIGS